MHERKSDRLDRSSLRRAALQRWDNEGGAGPGRLPPGFIPADVQSRVPPLANAELVQLQIRVIALENLLIALLGEASDRQLAVARAMATYISPRPGHTPHRLTIHAASEMLSLLERAAHFRTTPR